MGCWCISGRSTPRPEASTAVEGSGKNSCAKGCGLAKHRVKKFMALHGIRAGAKRKYMATTDAKYSSPVAPNLLGREFKVDAPFRVWTSDITCIDTGKGWLYLAAVIDFFSRQIAGRSMRMGMKKKLVVDALRIAWFRRHPKPGVIFHSDRGSQYCSAELQAALGSYGMRSLMSRKGDCWDNASTESLWGSLKVARLHGVRFATCRAVMDKVIDWISFYNHRRLHSALDNVNPMRFQGRWLADQEKQAA